MKSIIDSGGIGDLKRFVWIATNAYRPGQTHEHKIATL
jgi:hypothetical protein